MLHMPTALRVRTSYTKLPFIKDKIEDKGQSIIFDGFPFGENTNVQASQLHVKELAACIDLKLNPGGRLQTRDAIIKYSTGTAIGSIKDVKSCSLNGTRYIICTDATKVYYFVSTVPTLIGTLGAPAKILAYNDVALIMDGSYLKYLDSTSIIKMAYDGGTDGTVFDNYNGTDDDTVALSAAGVGCVFTTPSWTAGYTIPITNVEFKVQDVGASPTITVVLDRVSDDVVMASKTYNVNDIPSAAADFLEVSFSASDITHQMSPGVAYRCLLKGTDVTLQVTTVASGGTMITGGTTAVTTQIPIMRVHPGIPPKATWGVVSGSRLWIYNPDRPGGLHYGNLTHLDFSTTNGGGWVGAVDEDQNSFNVGAAEDLYGTLYVYGTQETPYLCKLTGTSPADYALPKLFQRVWSTQDTIENVNNDIINGSKDGVDALTGVQEYGDLRTSSISDPIKDRLVNWSSTTAFSGYNVKDGQYWLYMPAYDYVNISHVTQVVEDHTGKKRYPWTRYTLPITPTCFSQVGDLFLIGSSDGYFYTPTTSTVKDLETSVLTPSFKTSYTILPFKTIDIIKAQILAASSSGGSLNFKIYKNSATISTALTKAITLTVSDALTLADVEELTLAEVADMLIVPALKQLYFNLNLNCFSFQIECSDITLVKAAVYLNGVIIKYLELEA